MGIELVAFSDTRSVSLLTQGDTIQDSLTDVPLTQNKSVGQKDKDSDTFLQVLHDNSSVIVSRGPGGSVKIAKAPDSGGTSKLPALSFALQCHSLEIGFVHSIKNIHGNTSAGLT